MKKIFTIISIFLFCLTAKSQTKNFQSLNIDCDKIVSGDLKNYCSYDLGNYTLYIGYSTNNLKVKILSKVLNDVKFTYDETESDAMIIKPKFFESSDKKVMVIMLELAAEYSWGQKLVMINNNGVFDCGFLDFMTNEGNGESIAEYAVFKQVDGQVILTFQPGDFVDRDYNIIKSESLKFILKEEGLK
jgi:hypothetical protein